MSSPQGPDPSRADASAGPRQLALVSLCVLGLLVAAFAMPALTDPSSDGSAGDATATDPGPITDIIDAILRYFFTLGGDGGGGDDRWIVLDGDGPPIDGCVVAIQGEQSPGSRVLVHAWQDKEPLPGLAVRFNDRLVGETDSKGTVFGRVPYREELDVSVSRPAGTCTFFRAREPAGNRSAESARPSRVVGSTRPSAHEPAAASLVPGPSLGGMDAQETAPGGNSSRTYNVTGAVDLRVRGDPYPGEEVTVLATVRQSATRDGRPMRNATVQIDGERAGRTNRTGGYTFRVPDDGTEQTEVTVSRGDFSGRGRIRLLVLHVAVRPSGVFAFPGSDATISSDFGGRERANATVRVDGDRIGTTGYDGDAAYTMPWDPRTNVQVRARGQVTTTTLWPAYGATIAVFGLLAALFVGSGATAVRRGRRSVELVAAGWAVFALVVTGFVVAGPTGGLAVLGLLVVVGIAASIARRGDEVSGNTRSIRAMIADAVEWLLARALHATETLELAVDWAHDALAALRARLETIPEWTSALTNRLAAWADGVSADVRDALDGRVTARTVAAVAVCLAVLAGATWARGIEGFAAALTLVAGVCIAVLVRRNPPASWRGTAGERSGEDGETPGRIDGPAVGPSSVLGEQWRTFARRVAPADWRRRTPGEVSRAAVERGYPPEAVARLARIFREVEYDDRPLSQEREARASEAFEALERSGRDDADDGNDAEADAEEDEQ